jgi:hypothetical protein
MPQPRVEAPVLVPEGEPALRYGSEPPPPGISRLEDLLDECPALAFPPGLRLLYTDLHGIVML